MGEFAQWVRTMRQEGGFDIRDFAKRTGVDPSTISRIENGRTQATLYTAIRICVGLGINLQTFSQMIGHRHIGVEKKVPRDWNKVPVLTQQDMVGFMEQLSSTPELALQMLAELINEFRLSMVPSQSDVSKLISGSVEPRHLSMFLDPLPIFRFSLQYPPHFGPQDIFDTYLIGGALNLMDVGSYLRGLRRKTNATLERFTGVSKRPASVLNKLELGVIENIKLSDVLDLDIQLSENGEIISMYWDAVALNVKVGSYKIDGDIANLLLVTSRWLQERLADGPPEWLHKIRYKLETQQANRSHEGRANA